MIVRDIALAEGGCTSPWGAASPRPTVLSTVATPAVVARDRVGRPLNVHMDLQGSVVSRLLQATALVICR